MGEKNQYYAPEIHSASTSASTSASPSTHAATDARSADQPAQQRGLSVAGIKTIALVFTFFSVLATAIFPTLFGIENMVGLTLAAVSEVLSWLAVPLIAWLTVQGIKHTCHMNGYLARVFVLALLSEVPYDMVTTGKAWDFSSQNPVWAVFIIIFTFSMRGEIMKNVSAKIGKVFSKHSRNTLVLDTVIFVLAAMWMLMLRVGIRQQLVPLGLIMLVFAYIYYFLGLKENTMMLLSGIFGAMCVITPGIGAVVLHYRNDYKMGYSRDNRVVQLGWYGAYLLILVFGTLFVVF